MRARATLYRAGALLAAIGLGMGGLAVIPAAASSAAPAVVSRAAAGSRAAAKSVDRYNVGATHSPELLRQLAAGGQSVPLRAGTRAGVRSATPTGGELGVDVASFQHPGNQPIDWKAVAAAGVSFAAIKVTEGAYYVNPWAIPNANTSDPGDLAGAQQAGLSEIAYAFAIPNGNGGSASPVNQADYLVNHLPALPATPPVMLDIEYNPYGAECYGLTKAKMRTWIQRFENEITAKTGYPAIIYSTRGWLDACAGSTASFARYPLWIASYTGAGSPGMLPNGWTDWGIWQYTSGGTVSGIPASGGTDLDVFNPDSVLDPGKLMVFNPGYQQAVAGSGAVQAEVNAYPEEPSPSLAFNQTGLPAAWSLSTLGPAAPGTVQITGAAAAGDGSFPVSVTVTDSGAGGGSGSVDFTWYSHGALALAAPGAQTTAAGAPVDLNLAAGLTDTTTQGAPVAFQVAGLPPGLSMTPSGQITGWPDDSADSPYKVTVQAADRLMAPASETFTWTVKPAPKSAPTGAFRLALGGKCLNDVGDRTRDGNRADLWTCNGSAAQRWTYAADFTVRIHGKCLTAPASAGGKVALEPCQSLGDQVWRPVSPTSVNPGAASVPLAFVNSPSGMCLSDSGFATKNGTSVVSASCDGFRNQAWTSPAGPVGSQLPGKCLDDRGGRRSNGTPIDLWSCKGSARQRWTARADGTLRVLGKCLDVRRGARAAGTPVELWKCDGTAAQQWRLVPDGDGVDLVNPHSGKCLTDRGNATRNGTRLRIEACVQAPGQRWHVQ